MATQSFIFKHEDSLCAAQEAIQQLREALAIEANNADVVDGYYTDNAEVWDQAAENACTLAKLATLFADEVAAAWRATNRV